MSTATDEPAKVQSASQTAQEYIKSQLDLEEEAKEALPYQFDTCTRPLGPLRQSLYSCLTCNPPSDPSVASYTPAGVCYSCSISCHGEHTLVELFGKRDFECDCGTTRVPADTPCALRTNSATQLKGNVTGEAPRSGNKYNHNFAGHFCGCGDTYDPMKEKGTMFQCLGLGPVESGGCGEDWWHPECLLGLSRETKPWKNEQVKEGNDAGDNLGAIAEKGQDTSGAEQTEAQHDVEVPLPDGFPEEDNFDHLICYKCVESNPWIKRYAGTPGFLPAVFFPQERNGLEEHVGIEDAPAVAGAKRKAEDDEEQNDGIKRAKVEDDEPAPAPTAASMETAATKHQQLPDAPTKRMSLFLKEDFRDHFCKCPECFPHLKAHPQLLEEEETYEPPVSEGSEDGANGGGSLGSRSLLERGEAALSTMDRMKAIEGVMAYNHLRDKVKAFLQPFAESGQAVGAEDVKAYFAKLRGDEEAMRSAAGGAGGDVDGNDVNRNEQSGY